MPAIEALEQQRLISAAAYPYLKEFDRRRYQTRLRMIAQQRRVHRTARWPNAPQDPAAAAEWLAGRGIEVVKVEAG